MHEPGDLFAKAYRKTPFWAKNTNNLSLRFTNKSCNIQRGREKSRQYFTVCVRTLCIYEKTCVSNTEVNVCVYACALVFEFTDLKLRSFMR